LGYGLAWRGSFPSDKIGAPGIAKPGYTLTVCPAGTLFYAQRGATEQKKRGKT
jgi:hypothetical protein